MYLPFCCTWQENAKHELFTNLYLSFDGQAEFTKCKSNKRIGWKKNSYVPYRISFKHLLRRLTVVNHPRYPSASKRASKFFTVRNCREGSLADTNAFPKNLIWKCVWYLSWALWQYMDQNNSHGPWELNHHPHHILWRAVRQLLLLWNLRQNFRNKHMYLNEH